jgi:cell division protein FtsB
VQLHTMRNRGRKWYWLSLIVVAAVGVGYAWEKDVYARYLEGTREERKLVQRREAVQEQETARNRAQQRVQDLVTDSLEIETEIRGRKRLVREGEVVYRLEAMPADEIGGAQ